MKKSVKDFRVGDEFVLKNDISKDMHDSNKDMEYYSGKTMRVESCWFNLTTPRVCSCTYFWYDCHIDFDATNKLYEKGHKMTNSEPTRTVNVTKTNGDSVQMKFSYKDSEETVEYAVDGNGDLGDIMEMLREVTTFFGHLGFSEETSLKFMKQYVEQNEI